MMWSAIYGSIALVAGLVAWRTELRPLALALLATFVITFLEGKVLGVPLPARTIVYVALNLGIISAAAFNLARYPGTAPIVITLSVVALAATAAFTWQTAPSKEELYLWNVATNMAFGAQCLMVICSGIYDVLVDRSAGVLDWPSGSWLDTDTRGSVRLAPREGSSK